MLRIEGIDVYYGDLQAIRDVSLSIDAGEIVSHDFMKRDFVALI